MSETAQTLIKASLRSIGAIATGETPPADELQEGLEAMKLMLRSWSANGIRLYSITSDTLTMTGADSYTIGNGGTVNTARPSDIKGARTSDRVLDIIGEAKYRELKAADIVGPTKCIWYNPTYPLGTIYALPVGSDTVYLDSIKPLTDPTAITSSVSFPPEYDDAIKWNLAVRLAPEYGKEATQTVASLAMSTLHALETRNFSNMMNEARVDLMSVSNDFNIDAYW